MTGRFRRRAPFTPPSSFRAEKPSFGPLSGPQTPVSGAPTTPKTVGSGTSTHGHNTKFPSHVAVSSYFAPLIVMQLPTPIRFERVFPTHSASFGEPPFAASRDASFASFSAAF